MWATRSDHISSARKTTNFDKYKQKITSLALPSSECVRAERYSRMSRQQELSLEKGSEHESNIGKVCPPRCLQKAGNDQTLDTNAATYNVGQQM